MSNRYKMYGKPLKLTCILTYPITYLASDELNLLKICELAFEHGKRNTTDMK